MADVAAGIRDDLAAAIASVDAPETPVEAVESAQETSAPEEAEAAKPASGERQRSADGKFLPKDAKEPGEEPAAAPEAAPEVEKAEPVQPAAPDPTARWSDADKAMFKTLPKDGQDFLLRRHKDMEADYTKKTGAIAEFKKTYEPVDQMFAPFKAQMRQQGWTESSLIKAWADVEQQLMSGKGHEVVARIIKDYRIDPSKISGVSAAPAQAQAASATGQTPTAATFDPAVEQLLEAKFGKIVTPLQEQLQALSNEAASRQRAAQIEQQRAAEQTVQNFIDAKLPSGEAAHPHYSEVEQQMVTLARIERQEGRVPDLNQLYERAVWATPSTREKLLAAQQAAQARKSQDEARAKAAAAKKAGSSVTGAPTGPAQTAVSTGPKSLREQLLEAAAEHDAA